MIKNSKKFTKGYNSDHDHSHDEDEDSLGQEEGEDGLGGLTGESVSSTGNPGSLQKSLNHISHQSDNKGDHKDKDGSPLKEEEGNAIEEEEEQEGEEEGQEEEEEKKGSNSVRKKSPIKLTKYPVFKQPVVKRERVGVINMHIKPTLSKRQKQRLRRPLEPRDLPASAYASAQGLIAALRSHYDEPFEEEEYLLLETEAQAQTEADLLEAIGAIAVSNANANANADVNSVIVPVPMVEGDHLMIAQSGPEQGPVSTGIDGEALPTDDAILALLTEEKSLGLVDASDAMGAGPATTSTDAPVSPRQLPPVQGNLQNPALSVSPIKQPGSRASSPGRTGSVSRVLHPQLTVEESAPLPLNARESSSLFKEPSLSDVSVITDFRADAFHRIKAKEKQARRIKEKIFGDKAGAIADEARRAGHGVDVMLNSPFDPQRVPNNLAFMDAEVGAHSHFIGKQSVETFKRRGYVDGSSQYATHWREKLFALLDLYHDGHTLRKAISSLLKLNPDSLTKLEAFCALADSDGSQVEALGKLCDPEFMREVKTVCAMLPVTAILARLPGSILQDNSDVRPEAFEKGGTLRHENNKPGRQHFRTLEEDSAYQSLLGTLPPGSASQPTLFEQQNLSPGTVHAPLSQHTGSGGQLRLHGYTAAKLLPHMGMKQHSPIARSRGTLIKLKEDKHAPGFPFAQSGASTSFVESISDSLGLPPLEKLDILVPSAALSGVADAQGEGGIHPSLSSTDVGEDQTNLAIDAVGVPSPFQAIMHSDASVNSIASAGSYERNARAAAAPIRSSSPLSFNGSRKSTPKTHLNKSYGRASDILSEMNVSRHTNGRNKKRKDKVKGNLTYGVTASMDSLSVSSLHGSAAGAVHVPASKSVRLSHAIDELFATSNSHTLVMSRKDAQRAAGEEVLSRSEASEFRDVALKRSNNMINKMLAKYKDRIPEEAFPSKFGSPNH